MTVLQYIPEDTSLVFSIVFNISNSAPTGNGSNSTNIVGEGVLLSGSTKLVLMVLLALLIIGIILGNSLVILSVTVFVKMRTLSNCLVGSLASADLLVAIFVLPISLQHEFAGQWTLGREICELWITMDVFCCTASILNIVVIAIDRYWLITRNLSYTHSTWLPRRTVCSLLLAGAWLVSALIASAPLLGWRAGTERDDPALCVISQDYAYTVFSTFGAFWLPLSVILIVYAKIFHFARVRAKRRRSGATTGGNHVKTSDKSKNAGATRAATRNDGIETEDSTKRARNKSKSAGRLDVPSAAAAAVVAAADRLEVSFSEVTVTNDLHRKSLFPTSTSMIAEESCIEPETPPITVRRTSATNRHLQPIAIGITTRMEAASISAGGYVSGLSNRKCRAQRIRRSARTLGLVIGGFVACWMPFFIIATMAPFCPQCHVPEIIRSFVLWLGYCNSLFNPAIYAIWDQSFRRSFKRIISCDQLR